MNLSHHDRGQKTVAAGASREAPLVLTVPPVLPVPLELTVPQELTALIGRDREVAAVEKLIAQHRAVTVTGPGGMGKSSLVLRVAHRLRDAGVQVALVDLDVTERDSDVAPALARALGVPADMPSALVALAYALAQAPVVLVLDTCEHVVHGAAAAVVHLLEQCAGLRVVSASRKPLGVPGEAVLSLPPLALPAAPRPGRLAADIARAPATAMFVDRARARWSDFEVDAASAALVLDICTALDGLPLGIELAASRVRTLGLIDIRDGLNDTLGLLDGREARRPRLESLSASVEWSLRLLSPQEYDLFTRLGSFAAPFDLRAVRAVADAGEHPDTVLHSLDQLISHSLVLVRRGPGQAVSHRYVLLEPVRQAAQRLLCERGLAEQTAQAHARHFAQVAVMAVALEADEAAVLRLLPDVPDLRVALTTLATSQPDLLVAAVAALGPLWQVPGLLEEGLAWLDSVVAVVEAHGYQPLTPAASAPQVLAARADLSVQALRSTAPDDAAHALEVALASADPRAIGRASAPNVSLLFAADPGRAVELARIGLAAAVRAGDAYAEGRHRLLLIILLTQGLFPEARDLLREWGRPLPSHRALYALATAMVAETDGDLAGTEEALQAVENLIDERVTDPGTIASLAFGASWHAVRYGRPHASTAALAQRTEFALACGATLAAVYTTAAALAVACEADPPDHQLIRRLLSAAPPVDPAVANTAQFMVGELLALGRRGEASALVERLRHYADSLGALVLQARSARLAAVVAREGGDLHHARREAVAAARLLDVDRHVIEAIDVLEVSAGLQAAISPRSAAQAWGAIATLRRDRKYRWLGVTERLHRRADELLVSTALGEEGYRAAFAAGEQLSVRGALSVATHGLGGRGADAVGWESLTPTESQVARFVASGATNAEVAKRLLMGTETVKTHLKRIYLKLGLRSRTELAARARETGGSAG